MLNYRLRLNGPVSTIQAADANEKAINARKGLMQAIVHQMGGFMAKGKMDYDAERAKVWAANLDLLARVNQRSMWPPQWKRRLPG